LGINTVITVTVKEAYGFYHSLINLRKTYFFDNRTPTMLGVATFAIALVILATILVLFVIGLASSAQCEVFHTFQWYIQLSSSLERDFCTAKDTVPTIRNKNPRKGIARLQSKFLFL
jgi:hypothetical protein